jgi:hypothetical protein
MTTMARRPLRRAMPHRRMLAGWLLLLLLLLVIGCASASDATAQQVRHIISLPVEYIWSGDYFSLPTTKPPASSSYTYGPIRPSFLNSSISLPTQPQENDTIAPAAVNTGAAVATDEEQGASTHRQLPPCTNSPVYISSGNQALHTALFNMRSCDGTIIFTEPGAHFAPIDTIYRVYANLTLDASGISPGVSLGTENEPYFFLFQKGSSNSFFPGLTAKNIYFTNNTKKWFGQTDGSFLMGGIMSFLNGGTAIFEGCRFAGNTVTFETDGWGAVGGALLRAHNLTYTRFADCVFEDNAFNTVARGPALGFLWLYRPIGPTLFDRCIFRNNRVTASPGVAATAVYLDSDLAQRQPVVFSSCVFEENEGRGRAVVNNQAAHVCGAVCTNALMPSSARCNLDISFDDCVFRANRVTGELGAPTVAANVNALGAAAGLFFGATAAFAACTFTDNVVLNTAVAPGSTNTFRAFGGAVHLNGVSATIDSGIFIANSATGAVDARGGALGVWTSNNAIPSTTTISHTFFSSNKALATGAGARSAFGGGIATACAAAASCRLALSSSALESNTAMLMDSAITNTPVFARTCRLYACMHACVLLLPPCRLDTDLTFHHLFLASIKPRAHTEGGGLYATALRTAMTIDGSALTSNVAYARPASTATPAAVEGGGLFVLDSIANVVSTTFSGNSAWVDNAEPAGSRVGGGGAAVVTASSSNPSTLTLTSSSLLLNTVGGVPRHGGGALYKDVASQLSQVDLEVIEMNQDDGVAYKSFNDVNLGAPVRGLPGAFGGGGGEAEGEGHVKYV